MTALVGNVRALIALERAQREVTTPAAKSIVRLSIAIRTTIHCHAFELVKFFICNPTKSNSVIEYLDDNRELIDHLIGKGKLMIDPADEGALLLYEIEAGQLRKSMSQLRRHAHAANPAPACAAKP
jgi:hypothetical protein